MNPVSIHYLRVDPELDQVEFERLRRQLPENLQKNNDRFVYFLDRQRNLAGLLLLTRIWSNLFHKPLDLNDLMTNANHRPYLRESTVDFNISHAGDFVICALSPGARVGIDIEKRKTVDFGEFTGTMNHNQWLEINQSKDPVALFFKFWCIKESVIKADGRGLSIPLTEIIIGNHHTVTFQDSTWFIKPFKLDDEHLGCLACDQEIPDLVFHEVHWRQLIS